MCGRDMPKNIRCGSRWSEKDLKKPKKQVPGRMSVSAFKAATAPKILETDIQQDFFERLDKIPYEGGTLKDYVYAVPNGGYRAKRTASILKAEGVKPGVPDTHCFIAVAPFHSLYIEFKTETGDLSLNQECVIRLLREQGHKVVVCRSADSAVDQLLKYLGM